MTWRYQVIRTKYRDEESYGVHELYLGEDGEITGATMSPIQLVGDNLNDLIAQLDRIKSDIEEYGAIDEYALEEDVRENIYQEDIVIKDLVDVLYDQGIE